MIEFRTGVNNVCFRGETENIFGFVDHVSFTLTLIYRRRRRQQRMMAGWHHRFNGHELGQTPGDGEGQGSLACCRPWGGSVKTRLGRPNNKQKKPNKK